MDIAFILAGKSFDDYDFDRLLIGSIKLIALVNFGHRNSMSEETKGKLDEVIFVKDKEKLGPLFIPDIDYLLACTDSRVARFNPEKIYIICSDEGNLMAAAQLRERYSAVGMTSFDAFHLRDKVAMKKKLAKHNFPVPKNTNIDLLKITEDKNYYDTVELELGNPFVLKPKSAAAGFGVHRITSFDKIKELNDQNQFLETSYEAEELLTGDLYHCDLGIKNGELIFSECARYNTNHLDADTQNILIGSLVVRDRHPLKNKIITLCTKATKALSDASGFYHCEVFVDGSSITLLEIGARLPGAIITHLYNEMYGVNFFNLDFLLQIQEKIQLPLIRKYYGFWYLCFAYQKMEIKRIFQQAVSIEWLIKEKDLVVLNEDGYCLIGKCLYKNVDYLLVENYFHELNKTGIASLFSYRLCE